MSLTLSFDGTQVFHYCFDLKSLHELLLARFVGVVVNSMADDDSSDDGVASTWL